jgi:DNA-binding NtrC family response regulator
MVLVPRMAGKARILVAEDDDLTLELLVTALRGVDHDVTGVADGRSALELLQRERFDLVLADVQMPHASGMEILSTLPRIAGETPIILITAYADPGAVMDAIAQGAADYLTKPVDVLALRQVVARTIERHRRAGAGGAPAGATLEPKVLLGKSPAMVALYKQIAQVAPVDTTVLITGESGTGKELVARMIHQRSRRADKLFVAVNCAALAEGLLESELFGHERGAFTGAHTLRRGLFETAAGGTVFLDEVGDVPMKMQAQLLRVLQEGEVRRVGGSEVIPVDARVISATNRDLSLEVAARRMRPDLYYRLHVMALQAPPLRERSDDIPALARHIVAQHAARTGARVPEIADETLERLRAYAWPGNVRELENALARAMAVASRGVILPEDLPPLPPAAGADASEPPGIDHDWPSLEELERRYVQRVLERCGGNKTGAAQVLGVDRRTLQRLFARQGGRPEPE